MRHLRVWLSAANGGNIPQLQPLMLFTAAEISSLLRLCQDSFVYLSERDRLCGLVVKNSWIKIQRFDYSLRYQIFWGVVGLERGPLSLLSTIEELRGRESRGSGIENREHGRRDPSRWPRGTPYRQKLSLTSPTSCCRSVGVVNSRTQATEFSFFYLSESPI
jgi:hypothetical protein